VAKVAIVYFSRTGDTEKMARLVAEGVKAAGAEPIVKSVKQAAPADLLNADGVILGSPTYYGGPASEMKKFIDGTVKCHGRLTGKVGGAFASSANVGGGNEGTVTDLLKALLAHGMIIPGSAEGDHFGPVAIGAPDRRAAENCRRMGEIVGRLAVRLHG